MQCLKGLLGPEAIIYACLALPLGVRLPFAALVTLRLAIVAVAYSAMLALRQQPGLHGHTAMAGKLEHALRFLVSPAIGLAGDVSRRNIRLLDAVIISSGAAGTAAGKVTAPAPRPAAVLGQDMQREEPCMRTLEGLRTSSLGYDNAPSSQQHATFGGCPASAVLHAPATTQLNELSIALATGYTSYRRRMRVTVKLPHVDGQSLPHIDICAAEEKLRQYMSAEVRVQGMSVRSGCVIVELDLCQQVSAAPSDPLLSPRGPACFTVNPTASELVALLQLEGVTGASDGQVISVSLDNQVSLLRWDQACCSWVFVSTDTLQQEASMLPPATTMQAPPLCMALDKTLMRLTLALPSGAADDCSFEAVSPTGMPLPCTVISSMPSKAALPNQSSVSVVVEVDFSLATPGLARCNVWSAAHPVSCLLASQPLLLLPGGYAVAAAELSRVPMVADPATATDLFADIGELLMLGAAASPAAARPVTASAPPRNLAFYSELAETAQGALAWCQDARCPATSQLLAAQVVLLDGLIAKAVAAEDPVTPTTAAAILAAALGSRPGTPRAGVTEGVATGAGFTAGPSRLRAASAAAASQRARASAAGAESAGGLMSSLRATARRIDAALPLRQREMQTSSLPPTLWAIIVCCKCTAASVRSLRNGTGFLELPALILWGLPYVCMLIAQGLQRNAGGAGSGISGGGNAAPPSPTARVPSTVLSRFAATVLDHARVLLHVHRSLIVALMGLGYLRIPYVFSITSAGIDVPAKIMYMAMEAYDYRTAILVILLADIPAFFFLYTRLQVHDTLLHVVALGVLGVVMQLAMQSWRRLLDAPAPRAVKTA